MMFPVLGGISGSNKTILNMLGSRLCWSRCS